MGFNRGQGTRRRGFLGAAALGAALCALLGTGLGAVVVDSATSADNSVESGEMAGSPADLRAGILQGDERCDLAATTDQSTFPAAIDSATIHLSANSQVSAQRICLHNAGGSTGHAFMRFTSVFDGEANEVAGTCANNEATPSGGNDQSCGATDPGELSEVLDGILRLLIPCPEECVHPTFGFTFDGVTAARRGLLDLEPGQSIAIDLTLVVDDEATEQELQAAQTDRIQFDITFTFNDEEPAA